MDQTGKLKRSIWSIFDILKRHGYVTAALTGSAILEGRGFTGIALQDKLSLGNIRKTVGALKQHPFFMFIHYWNVHTPYKTVLPCESIRDGLANLISKIDKNKKIHSMNPIFRRIENDVWNYRIRRIRELLVDAHPQITERVKRGYREALIEADTFIGSVLEELDVANLMGNTLVIITSDHGDSFNEHNEVNRQIERRYEHGHFLYDSVLKVPLILCKGREFGPAEIACQVRSIDIVPTVADLLGLKEKYEYDGTSLVPLVNNRHQEDLPGFAYSEIVRNDQVEEVEKRSVRTAEYKLIIDYKDMQKELYDLRADPGETNNIIGKRVGRAAELERIIEKLGAMATKVVQEGGKDRKIMKTLKHLGYI
jgi:arylsulfatase A-like enzyme